MIRLFNMLAVIALIVSAIYTNSVKYEALAHHEDVRKLNAAIKKEREAISILNAEWTMLNRPERLQKLVDKHINLQQLDMRQLARLAEIPERPENRDNLAEQMKRLGVGGALTTPSAPADLSALMALEAPP